MSAPSPDSPSAGYRLTLTGLRGRHKGSFEVAHALAWRGRQPFMDTKNFFDRFLSTVELVNALEQEKLVGKQGRLANRFSHVDLVILETGKDSYRYKNSTINQRKEKKSA